VINQLNVSALATDTPVIGVEEPVVVGTLPSVGAPWPNPLAGGGTLMTFPVELAQAQAVGLTVHDVQGRLVGRTTRRILGPGRSTIVWEPGDLPSGVYFARVEAGGRSMARRVVVAR
jgi:hypothetical protein